MKEILEVGTPHTTFTERGHAIDLLSVPILSPPLKLCSDVRVATAHIRRAAGGARQKSVFCPAKNAPQTTVPRFSPRRWKPVFTGLPTRGTLFRVTKGKN
jgi:hypothetical protein